MSWSGKCLMPWACYLKILSFDMGIGSTMCYGCGDKKGLLYEHVGFCTPVHCEYFDILIRKMPRYDCVCTKYWIVDSVILFFFGLFNYHRRNASCSD